MSDCCCGGTTRLVYSCSGASDVGEIADKAARKLRKDGFGKMTCLAAIGAHLSGFVESAKATDENIAIDGCPVACARKCLEHIGVTPKSYILTEMGLVKGKTPVTEEVVSEISNKIKGKEQKTHVDGDKPDMGNCGCGLNFLRSIAMKYLKISIVFIAGLFILGVISINGLEQADAAKPEKKTVSKKQEAKKETQAQKKSDIKATFVELGSVDCIPCKMMQPLMKEIEKEYAGKVKVIFYDVWTEEGRPYAGKYKIKLIPTQVFLDKDGKEFYRHEGFFPKDEIVKLLESKGIKKSIKK